MCVGFLYKMSWVIAIFVCSAEKERERDVSNGWLFCVSAGGKNSWGWVGNMQQVQSMTLETLLDRAVNDT